MNSVQDQERGGESPCLKVFSPPLSVLLVGVRVLLDDLVAVGDLFSSESWVCTSSRPKLTTSSGSKTFGS